MLTLKPDFLTIICYIMNTHFDCHGVMARNLYRCDTPPPFKHSSLCAAMWDNEYAILTQQLVHVCGLATLGFNGKWGEGGKRIAITSFLVSDHDLHPTPHMFTPSWVNAAQTSHGTRSLSPQDHTRNLYGVRSLYVYGLNSIILILCIFPLSSFVREGIEPAAGWNPIFTLEREIGIVPLLGTFHRSMLCRCNVPLYISVRWTSPFHKLPSLSDPREYQQITKSCDHHVIGEKIEENDNH